MLTLFMYAVCLLVALKGAQLLQFAISETQPTKRWRFWVVTIGFGGFVVAVAGAVLLAFQFTQQALEIGRALEPLMK